MGTEGRSDSEQGPNHGGEGHEAGRNGEHELWGMQPQEEGYLKNLRYDLPSSVVVFLVALPLCLGIAVASGATPLAGLITGIVGGLVVAWASGSQLAVSGPAAGLTVIVLGGIQDLGGYEGFLLAVCIGGLVQIVLGLARAGIFAYYFPSSVIKGMLAAIGIILILKQIPHALGFDEDFEGDLTLFSYEHPNPFEAISIALSHVHVVAAAIALVGLGILVLWSKVPALAKLKWLPGPLVVVLLGVVTNVVLARVAPELVLAGDHVVSLPTGGLTDLAAAMRFPDFTRIGETEVWVVGFTIAAVASIETLLCIEAIDKLDPYKRSTPTNRELGAQGIGNLVSGLIGGLPLTAVIVRGSANIHAGARTKVSAFVHGIFLLAAVVILPTVMNLIPLAALAAVLLHVGYKLARIDVWRAMFRQSSEQWVPFVSTVVAIVATDLLKGVGIGMVIALFFILRANLKVAYFIDRKETRPEDGRSHVRIELSQNVSFLNRASVNKVLHELPRDTSVEIDGSGSQYIHPDVVELIRDFEQTAHTRGIRVKLVQIPGETQRA